MHLFSKDSFTFRGQLQNMKKVQNLCLCGLFAAVYVALSLANIRVSDVLEFRFAFLALAASAAYGGPIMGMTVGIAGDVISYFTVPQSGPFFPGFTLNYAILGFLFGMVLYHSKITPVRAFLASFCDFLVSCTLSTLWLHFMYGMEWKYLFTLRLVKCSISLAINSVLIYIVMKAFVKIIGVVRTPAKTVQS